jgi:RND family efflux transporter MFP subunit
MNALPLRISALAVFGVSLLAATAPSASLAQQGPDAPPPIVVVAPVSTEQMAQTVTVPGSVVSRSDAKIAAEVSGSVDWVAEIGATVEAGGPIARIDGAILEIEAKRAATAVKRLEARVEFLDGEVARLQQLIGKGSTTRQRLDQARSERDMARQDLAEAKFQAERAQYDLAQAEIKSPFPGRVVERLIQPGEYIERGGAVARVVDVSALEVTAQVPIASVAQLKEGDRVTIEGPDGQVVAAVRALVPVGDQVSRSAELRASLDHARWLVGTAVKVATPTETPRDVIAVPRDAVLLRPEGQAVYRIGEGDVAELVPVKGGLTTGDLVEVVGTGTGAPLKSGDRVVVRGGEMLQPGQKVQIQALQGPNASVPSRPG